MKKVFIIISVGIIGLASSWGLAKYEQEQMQIESQMQQRIEGILAKTLPSNSYLVTVKVDMENKEVPTARRTTTAKRGGSSLLGKNQYVLPGVPQKKQFATEPEANSETSVSGFSAETLVKHIAITILVAPDISE